MQPFASPWTLDELRSRLEDYLRRAERGTPIGVMRDGRTVVRILPAHPAAEPSHDPPQRRL